MKLAAINSGIDDSFTSSLRILLKGSVPDSISESVVVHAKHGKLSDRPSFHYFFVESAIGSGLMSEADLSGLQAMLQAGIAKLKAAITPGTASDLDVLMSFIAPGTGGSKAVNDLIAAAKTSPTQLSQNEDWWTNLFSTLNINDPTIQKDIQYQVADEVGQEMLRDPGLPEPGGTAPTPDVTQATQGAEQARQQTRDALDQSTYADELRQERSDADQWRQQLMDTIARGQERHSMASDKLNQLNTRLDQLMKRAPNTEDFMGPIGDMLLEFDSVRANAGRITNTTIKTINRRYDYDIPIITEAGLFDKLRTMMVNPKYTKRQAQSAASNANNVQAAKLAIKIATDHMREQFRSKLQDAGLTPSDIIKTYSQWEKLKSSGGDPNIIARLEEKLRQAFRLFNIKSDGSTGEVGPQDSTGGGASVADGGADPLNADKENPEAIQRGLPAPEQQQVLTQDPTGFQQAVAKAIMNVAIRVARAGGGYDQVITATKRVAKKAYKINPELTQQVWHAFVIWLRGQTG